MSNSLPQYDSPEFPNPTLHYVFFSIYLVCGVVAVPMQVRLAWVIFSSRTLRGLPAYVVVMHAAVANTLNMTAQTIVVLLTFRSNYMVTLLNKILGAVFQATWAVEYPMILILATNRLVAVALPVQMERIFTRKSTNVAICVCWSFGLFNLVLCLLPSASTLWDAKVPTFQFTDGTVAASILSWVDFWFAEAVVVISALCYLLVVLFLVKRVQMVSNAPSLRVELPLLSNFFVVFLLTAVLLYFWHRPPSNGVLYTHIFNVLVMIRFGFASLFGLVTNRTIRQRFFGSLFGFPGTHGATTVRTIATGHQTLFLHNHQPNGH